MPVSSFGSNIASLNAQRRLGRSTALLGASFERLSTGTRINRASDDAAGLAIADKLKTDVRLSGQAYRNINDGISLLNIMDGTLGEQNHILDRLSELAEQASNGTFSASQRKALDKEYRALVYEFGRLGDTTKFNGLKLLQANRDNELTNILLQAGITGGSTSRLGLTTSDTGTASGKINLETIPAYSLFSLNSTTSEQLFPVIGNAVLTTSVTDSTGKKRDVLISIENTFGQTGADTFTVSLVAFQRVSDTGGVGATTIGGGIVSDASHDWIASDSTNTFDIYLSTDDVGWDTIQFSFDNGTATATLDVKQAFSGVDFVSGGASAEPTTVIDTSGLETVNRAKEALTIISSRRAELSTIRGNVGAVQSRLLTAANLTSGATEALSTAESRIRDVDVAEEAANLAAINIRQQAGSAVLGLANLQPELLLRLLQN